MSRTKRSCKGRTGRNGVSYVRTESKISRILDTMLPVDSEAQAAQRQLDKVLASAGFARNERMSRFLRFVVERHLEGRDQELKESLIAIEVFARAPGYDSKQDPIVRTEASRLRARLNEYYLVQGKDDPVVIELPKGGYIPMVRSSERTDKPAALERARLSRKRVSVGAAALALLIVTLVAVSWW